jgi:hypothetical protein
MKHATANHWAVTVRRSIGMSRPETMLVGILDADVNDEQEFNRWYWEEHVAERLACPGFISARRFRAIEGSPRYIALYKIEGPEAVRTPEYLALALPERQSAQTKQMLAKFHVVVRNVYVELKAPEPRLL